MRRSMTLLFTLPLLCLACAKSGDRTVRGPQAKLERVAEAIQAKLQVTDAALTDAAGQLAGRDWQGERSRAVLTELCEQHAEAIDCAIIDREGLILTVEPEEYRSVEGTDISTQEHVQHLRRTQEPVLSSVFDSVEGAQAVDFAWPIFGRNRLLAGSVSMIVDPSAYFASIVKPLLGWDARNIWVLRIDGEIFYSRHPESIGTYPKDDKSYRHLPSLQRLVSRILTTPEGSGEFYRTTIGKADPRPERLLWRTVRLHHTELRVILLAPTS